MEGGGKKKKSGESMHAMCAICTCVFSAADKKPLFSTQCGHIFHASCLTEWLQVGTVSCPECRHPTEKSDPIKLHFNTVSVTTDEALAKLNAYAEDLALKYEAAKKINEQSAEEIDTLKEKLRKLEQNEKKMVETINFKITKEWKAFYNKEKTYWQKVIFQANPTGLHNEDMSIYDLIGCHLLYISILPGKEIYRCDLCKCEVRGKAILPDHCTGKVHQNKHQMKLIAGKTFDEEFQRETSKWEIALMRMNGRLADRVMVEKLGDPTFEVKTLENMLKCVNRSVLHVVGDRNTESLRKSLDAIVDKIVKQLDTKEILKKSLHQVFSNAVTEITGMDMNSGEQASGSAEPDLPGSCAQSGIPEVSAISQMFDASKLETPDNGVNDLSKMVYGNQLNILINELTADYKKNAVAFMKLIFKKEAIKNDKRENNKRKRGKKRGKTTVADDDNVTNNPLMVEHSDDVVITADENETADADMAENLNGHAGDDTLGPLGRKMPGVEKNVNMLVSFERDDEMPTQGEGNASGAPGRPKKIKKRKGKASDTPGPSGIDCGLAKKAKASVGDTPGPSGVDSGLPKEGKASGAPGPSGIDSGLPKKGKANGAPGPSGVDSGLPKKGKASGAPGPSGIDSGLPKKGDASGAPGPSGIDCGLPKKGKASGAPGPSGINCGLPKKGKASGAPGPSGIDPKEDKASGSGTANPSGVVGTAGVDVKGKGKGKVDGTNKPSGGSTGNSAVSSKEVVASGGDTAGPSGVNGSGSVRSKKKGKAKAGETPGPSCVGNVSSADSSKEGQACGSSAAGPSGLGGAGTTKKETGSAGLSKKDKDAGAHSNTGSGSSAGGAKRAGKSSGKKKK